MTLIEQRDEIEALIAKRTELLAAFDTTDDLVEEVKLLTESMKISTEVNEKLNALQKRVTEITQLVEEVKEYQVKYAKT